MKKLVFILPLLFFMACKQKQVFKETSSGLKYLFVEEYKDQKQPQYGEGVIISVKIIAQDSVIFEDPRFKLIIDTPKYKGSIDEALHFMHLYDSAVFKIDAYNFYKYNADKTPMPEFLHKGDSLIFYIRLQKIISRKELEKEKEVEDKILKANELLLLDEYLADNNITVEPTKSGLYFLNIKPGNGNYPEIGDSVIFDYRVMLINGKVVEDSKKTGKPMRAKIGDGTLYLGVAEGLLYMREGGVARLIIPSKLALGGNEIPGKIPPYSTLIFDIQLLKVKRNN